MLELSFLIPFICVCLSFSWMACAKAACNRNYDSVAIVDSPIWPFIQTLTIICLMIALVIVIIKAGFLAFLCYLGIALGCILLGQFTVTLILVLIFGYEGLGALFPPISCIGTIIWMFSSVSSLS